MGQIRKVEPAYGLDGKHGALSSDLRGWSLTVASLIATAAGATTAKKLPTTRLASLWAVSPAKWHSAELWIRPASWILVTPISNIKHHASILQTSKLRCRGPNQPRSPSEPVAAWGRDLGGLFSNMLLLVWQCCFSVAPSEMKTRGCLVGMVWVSRRQCLDPDSGSLSRSYKGQSHLDYLLTASRPVFLVSPRCNWEEGREALHVKQGRNY